MSSHPPPGYVMHVKHVIQGHPESPWLWDQRIDKILHHLKFHPTIHEPCLYIATIKLS